MRGLEILDIEHIALTVLKAHKYINLNVCKCEIAEIIVQISGKRIPIQYDRTKPEGDKGRCGDCSKARTVLGWHPEVAIEEGLADLYTWIESRL